MDRRQVALIALVQENSETVAELGDVALATMMKQATYRGNAPRHSGAGVGAGQPSQLARRAHG